MAYTPTGIVSMCNVPFSTDRAHTRYFTTEQEQTTYFSSRVINTSSNYTFLRKDNIIRVPYNIEQIRNCNYVYYINQNFGNKVFYNFVMQVEYINENTTALHIQQDDFQTWMFNIRFLKSFVEREHTNDDTKYSENNIEEEDFTFSNYIRHHMQNIVPNTTGIYTPNAVVVVSTETYDVNKKRVSEPLTQVGALKISYYYAIFNLSNNDSENLRLYLKTFQELGITDSIVNIFICDISNLGNIVYSTTLYGKVAESILLLNTQTFNPIDENDFIGYTPKNNKMYNYPFRYIESGSDTISKEYKYEYLYSKSFVMQVSLSDRLTAIICPTDYAIKNAVTENSDSTETGITIELSADIPYYKNNASVTYALNKNSLETTLSNAKRDFITHIATGIADVATTNFMAFPMAGASLLSGGLGGAVSSLGTSLISSERAVTDTINTAISDDNKRRSIEAKIKDISLLPTVPKGSFSSNYDKYAQSRYILSLREYCISSGIAEKADNYLSVYGYKTNKFKIPNLTGRSRWNYVKTSGANIAPKTSGIIPPDTDIENIKNMFNNGITLWHDNNIMDYGDFSNDIIT